MRETLLSTEKIIYQIIFIPLLIGTLITIGFSIYVWIDLYNNVKIVDYSTTNTYTLTSNNKQLTILGRTYNLENDINNVKVDETIFGLTLDDRWYIQADYKQKIEYKSRISYTVNGKTYESSYIIADVKGVKEELSNEHYNLYFNIIPIYIVVILVIVTILMGIIYFNSARNLKIYLSAVYGDRKWR